MANWGHMEPAAAEVWVACDYQMAADWSMEPAAQVWVPDLPVDTHEMSGSCLQTSVAPTPSCGGQQQLVAYAAATAKAAPQDQFEVDIVKEMEMKIHDNPIDVFKETSQVFSSDIKKMGFKIHKYPMSIINTYIDKRYSVPSTVAIGPYWHGSPELKEAERVKHVAAYECIRQSGHSVQDMYDAVVLDADYARSLYDEDVVAKFSNDDFWPMMFYDACFLVQYMLYWTDSASEEMDEALQTYFNSNDEIIFKDIMMLENQIPWKVVETLMTFRDVPLEIVARSVKGCLQERIDFRDENVEFDSSYKPPHLLGFLRFCIVGRRSSDYGELPDPPKDKSVAISVSAIVLTEIGITISSTTELMDIGIKEGDKHKLYLPELCLTDSCACILVNMAAFELCTVADFQSWDGEEEDSAICSYLQLLAMIVGREEDVRELRKKNVLQGGGLTDNHVLEFFNCVQDFRPGTCFLRTVLQISLYKDKSSFRVKWHSFLHKNKKTLIASAGAVSALASILGTIISFKNGQ